MKPHWMVVHWPNGHATPVVGDAIELFDSAADAWAKAEALALQFQGKVYAVAEIIGSAVVTPTLTKVYTDVN